MGIKLGEGMVAKGGLGSKPITPPPPAPKGQGGRGASNGGEKTKKYDARTIKAVIRQLNKMADRISDSIEHQKDIEGARDPKAKWSTFLIVLCGQSTILRREACEMLEEFMKRYAI